MIALLLSAEDAVSFYVDSEVKAVRQKGTAESPFRTLERAVAAAYRQAYRRGSSENGADPIPVSIFIRSDVYVEEAVFLTVPITIYGVNNPTVTFGENAGFVVDHTVLEINDCALNRSERITEPRTVPLLYGAPQSRILLKGVSVTAKEGGDAVILRESRLLCTDTVFTSAQSAQAVLIRAAKSVISAAGSTFSAKGLMALCFDLTGTQCNLTQTSCILSPRYTGRAAELTDSELKAADFRCSYTSPLFDSIDAAVIADAASAIDLQEPLEFTGFLQPVVRR